jgi:sulfur-oxidizing protein SoxY
MNRRSFLQNAFRTGALASLVTAGLALPKQVWAAWNQKAFKSKSYTDAVNELYGNSALADSDNIILKAPDIAENGAVVPITVESELPNIESISILVEANPSPLAAEFKLAPGMRGFASTRLKMGKTSNVHAVVKADGQLYKATKEVKVTIGGCGG